MNCHRCDRDLTDAKNRLRYRGWYFCNRTCAKVRPGRGLVIAVSQPAAPSLAPLPPDNRQEMFKLADRIVADYEASPWWRAGGRRVEEVDDE